MNNQTNCFGSVIAAVYRCSSSSLLIAVANNK